MVIDGMEADGHRRRAERGNPFAIQQFRGSAAPPQPHRRGAAAPALPAAASNNAVGSGIGHVQERRGLSGTASHEQRLEPLKPVGSETVQRAPREEERRGNPELTQDWQRILDVTRKVVVKSQSNGRPRPGPSGNASATRR